MKQAWIASLILMVVAAAAPALAADELFPPNAKPGECYTRTFVPADYNTVTEKVLVREASSRLEIIPAKFETVQEKVLVREASTKLVEVPATYDTVTEKILVKPAHTTWKEGRGPVEKVDNSTGEIMCLIEVPAEYKTITKRVVKTPATTRQVEVPAEYKTLTVRKVAQAEKSREIEIPAEYRSVTRREQTSDGRMAWSQILCETNTTGDVVRKVQNALQRAGYSVGPIDGQLGSQTMAAMSQYQSAKGLARGGLTLETLKSLGIR